MKHRRHRHLQNRLGQNGWRHDTPKWGSRAAFSLVEVMTVLAVVGLLSALLIPAIQHVRNSARNTECTNQLRQLGIALHNFEQAHGYFPTAQYRGALDRYIEGSQHLLICPADERFDAAQSEHEISYLLNDGTKLPRPRDARNGFIATPARASPASNATNAWLWPLKARDVTDGLSVTAAASERLVLTFRDRTATEAEMRQDPARFLWWLSRDTVDESSLARACMGSERRTPFPSDSGCVHFVGCGYNHILTPNRVGCHVGVGPPSPSPSPIRGVGYAAMTATSQHSGFVNLLMLDGVLRHVNDSIDHHVWKAVGTRNGGESETL